MIFHLILLSFNFLYSLPFFRFLPNSKVLLRQLIGAYLVGNCLDWGKEQT